MSDERPDWSRRKLIQYGGVGIGLAIAGCNSADDSDEEDPDSELPENPADTFELAGDGSAGFREWLAPEYTLESPAAGELRQLYQFVDYGEISSGEMENQRQQRRTFADRLGIQPEQIERELLLGPINRELPYRTFFGSFDAEALTEAFEASGFKQTGEVGEFVVLDETFAISDSVIIEHPNNGDLIEGMQTGQDPFEEIDEEMGLLLDLIPAGPQVTINSRGDHDDVVLDGQTIFEINGPYRTHTIRTLVFTEESAATSERVRELDIDGTVRNEVLTEEINGRVAMIESEYQE